MKIKLKDIALLLIGLGLCAHVVFEHYLNRRSKTVQSEQLLRVLIEKDSLNREQQRKDSLIQLQIDTAYAVIGDLATQKAASTQQKHTWKVRIDSINAQRSRFLKQQNQ